MQAKFLLQREVKNFVEYNRIKNPSFEVHFHSQIELYLVLDGTIEIIVNNHKRILKKGELSVALSYDTHGYRNIDNSEVLFLSIPTSFCGDFLTLSNGKRLPSPFIDSPEDYEIIRGAMEKIYTAPNELAMRGYIYVILGAILERMTSDQSEDYSESRFSADMLIYISEHFKEDIGLSSLAKHFGYNSSYLSRSFRQTFGISFGRYLTMLRLREFILLLREGNQSITECAFECGFGSMRSFYRAFRDEFGCSPKEYCEADKKK